MALGIVRAGEGLLNRQGAAGPQEGQRGWLTPMVTHQAQALAAHPIRTLPVDCHVQSGQPMPGGAGAAGIVAHDRVRLPVQHPTRDTPPQPSTHTLVISRPTTHGTWSVGVCCALVSACLELRVGNDQAVVCPQPPPHPLLIGRAPARRRAWRPRCSDSPKWGVGFKRLNTRQQLLSARHDPKRPPPRDPIARRFCLARG